MLLRKRNAEIGAALLQGRHLRPAALVEGTDDVARSLHRADHPRPHKEVFHLGAAKLTAHLLDIVRYVMAADDPALLDSLDIDRQDMLDWHTLLDQFLMSQSIDPRRFTLRIKSPSIWLDQPFMLRSNLEVAVDEQHPD